MHNMFANFAIILRACKHFAQELVNRKGNMPKYGDDQKSSDQLYTMCNSDS